MGCVLYLTGVPGSGKTTTAEAMQNAGNVAAFSYSERLGQVLGASRAELRGASAELVGPDAVAAVDKEVAEFVAEMTPRGHVVIDSHAVTYERYGMRVIPFAVPVLRRLCLAAVACLTARPEIIASRVASASDGRANMPVEQIAAGQRLQDSVALSYSFALGIPLHVVDTSPAETDAASILLAVLDRAQVPADGTR